MPALEKRVFLLALPWPPGSVFEHISYMLQCRTVIFERACHTTPDIHNTHTHTSFSSTQEWNEGRNLCWHPCSVNVPRTHHRIIAVTTQTYTA